MIISVFRFGTRARPSRPLVWHTPEFCDLPQPFDLRQKRRVLPSPLSQHNEYVLPLPSGLPVPQTPKALGTAGPIPRGTPAPARGPPSRPRLITPSGLRAIQRRQHVVQDDFAPVALGASSWSSTGPLQLVLNTCHEARPDRVSAQPTGQFGRVGVGIERGAPIHLCYTRVRPPTPFLHPSGAFFIPFSSSYYC